MLKKLISFWPPWTPLSYTKAIKSPKEVVEEENNIPLYYFKTSLVLSSFTSRVLANKDLKKITIICLPRHTHTKTKHCKTKNVFEEILNEKIIAHPFLISFPYIVNPPFRCVHISDGFVVVVGQRLLPIIISLSLAFFIME